MPRYYFSTVDGQRYPDEEGADLADMTAVRQRATRIIGELLKEQPAEFWDTGRLKLEVADERGDPVFAVEVSLRT